MKYDDLFYAKIMLFGEYSVIKQSMALTIPYTHFNGSLQFIIDDRYTNYQFARQSNLQLYHLLGYIRRLKQQELLMAPFNADAFARDLSKGLYFESTIPQDYGIGSSGALIAALYQRYANCRKITRQTPVKEILQLKAQFAQLESFYHGTSSGIDPLNAYIKYPLLIDEMNNQIKLVKIPEPPQLEDGAIFIVNTGRTGKTGPLVNVFLERCKSGEINCTQLKGITNKTIESLLVGDGKNFFIQLQELSQFQLKYMKAMVPEDFIPLWHRGLQNNGYYLKICGSGGGGFLLGFTRNFRKTRQILKEFDVVPEPVYQPNKQIKNQKHSNATNIGEQLVN